MKIIRLMVPPCPKPRMTRADTWKKRPSVLRYWEYKDQLVLEARKAGFTLKECDMHIIYHIKMLDSWSKKKKSQNILSPHRQKPDLDNLLKATQDCLASNDAFIYDIRISKVWDEVGYTEIRIG